MSSYNKVNLFYRYLLSLLYNNKAMAPSENQTDYQ